MSLIYGCWPVSTGKRYTCQRSHTCISSEMGCHVRMSESPTVTPSDTRSRARKSQGPETRDVTLQVSVYLWGPSSDRSSLSCTFNR